MMPDCRSINSSISFRLNWSIPLYFSVLTLRPTRAAPSQGDEHLLRPLVQSEHVQLFQPPVSREDVEPLPGDHSREKTLMRSHTLTVGDWFQLFLTTQQIQRQYLNQLNLLFELSI